MPSRCATRVSGALSECRLRIANRSLFRHAGTVLATVRAHVQAHGSAGPRGRGRLGLQRLAGTVYPATRPRDFDPLRYLADYLDLIEINSSFYGPPKVVVARKWIRRVEAAETFRFTAKLWRRFTHERDRPWTRADVRSVRRGFDVLNGSGRLDAVLAQFPWSFRHTEAGQEWLDDLVNEFEDYPLVLEVRHESWSTPHFLARLAERGVGIVNVDQPLFRRSIRPSAHVTAATGYVRVHGRNYSDSARSRRLAHETSEQVDVVFNNHYRGQAVVNALQFRRLLEGRKVAAPPVLVDAYPDALTGYARAAGSASTAA